MPTFTFTDPNGRQHEVTGPPGATQEQAFGILQQRLASQPEPAPAVERRAEPRTPSSVLERFAAGIADPVYGAAQIADKLLVNPIRQAVSPGSSSMADVIKAREADYVAPEGIDFARMGGNIANPISWAGGGAGVGRAALAGAAQSALAPVDPDADFATEKGKQAAFGGVAGGVLAKVLPRIVRPIKPTQDAEALQAAGVTLTPGQAAGGFLNKVEQQAQSLPIVGDIIGKGRARSLDDFQTRAIERAVGAERGKGPQSIDTANEAVSDLYQRVVPKLRPTDWSLGEVQVAAADALDNPELTQQGKQVLDGLYLKLFGEDGERYSKLSGGTLKDLDTELGALVRKYKASILPSDKALGDEIHNLQQAMREGWREALDPADASMLDAANRAYRKMIPVNKAGSSRADERVMPRALQKALARQAGKDVSRMPKDDFITPAVRVLPPNVPDSGTAGRLALPAAVLGGLAAPGAALPVLAGGLGTVATGAAYSRAGSNLLTGNTNVQRKLMKMTPAARKAFIAALRAQQSAQPEQE